MKISSGSSLFAIVLILGFPFLNVLRHINFVENNRYLKVLYLSSTFPHLISAILQFALHVWLSVFSVKLAGQAHVKFFPPGASRQRCEQFPLSSPQGFGAENKLTYIKRNK